MSVVHLLLYDPTCTFWEGDTWHVSNAVDGELQQTPDGPALLIGKSLYLKNASPVSPKGSLDESLSGWEAFLNKSA